MRPMHQESNIARRGLAVTLDGSASNGEPPPISNVKSFTNNVKNEVGSKILNQAPEKDRNWN